MVCGLLTTRHREWKKIGKWKDVTLQIYTFLGNRKAGIKWKKENLDDLSHSKVKRFHSDDKGEPKGMKAKKRKNEQKDPSQVS